jgi:hypothetical protein
MVAAATVNETVPLMGSGIDPEEDPASPPSVPRALAQGSGSARKRAGSAKDQGPERQRP